MIYKLINSSSSYIGLQGKYLSMIPTQMIISSSPIEDSVNSYEVIIQVSKIQELDDLQTIFGKELIIGKNEQFKYIEIYDDWRE